MASPMNDDGKAPEVPAAGAGAAENDVPRGVGEEATPGEEVEATSADYYFDSYSHFGIHEVRRKFTCFVRNDRLICTSFPPSPPPTGVGKYRQPHSLAAPPSSSANFEPLAGDAEGRSPHRVVSKGNLEEPAHLQEQGGLGRRVRDWHSLALRRQGRRTVRSALRGPFSFLSLHSHALYCATCSVLAVM